MKAPLICVVSFALIFPSTSYATQCSSEDNELNVEYLSTDSVGTMSYALRLKSKRALPLDEMRKNYDLQSTLVSLRFPFSKDESMSVSEQRIEPDGSLCLVLSAWPASIRYRQTFIDVTGLNGEAPTVCFGKDGLVTASFKIATDHRYAAAVQVSMKHLTRPGPAPTVIIQKTECS